MLVEFAWQDKKGQSAGQVVEMITQLISQLMFACNDKLCIPNFWCYPNFSLPELRHNWKLTFHLKFMWNVALAPATKYRIQFCQSGILSYFPKTSHNFGPIIPSFTVNGKWFPRKKLPSKQIASKKVGLIFLVMETRNKNKVLLKVFLQLSCHAVDPLSRRLAPAFYKTNIRVCAWSSFKHQMSLHTDDDSRPCKIYLSCHESAMSRHRYSTVLQETMGGRLRVH